MFFSKLSQIIFFINILILFPVKASFMSGETFGGTSKSPLLRNAEPDEDSDDPEIPGEPNGTS